MGQSSSRVPNRRPVSSSSATQIRTTTQDDDNNPTPSELPPAPHTIGAAATTKKPRPSLRRSVLGLVSRSSSSSLASPKDRQTRHSEKTHSLRKRWRPSKRPPKTASTSQLPQRPDAHSDSPQSDPVIDLANREDASLPEAGPSSSTTPLRASRPSTPFPISRPPTPRIDVPPDDEALSEEERRLSQNIGTWLSGAAPSSPSSIQPDPTSSSSSQLQSGPIEREPSEYLSAHSHINSDDTPPHTPVDTSASNPSGSPPLTSIEQPSHSTAPPRHFPPPGTLVVVQGVVNTTDAPPPPPSTSRPHISSAPRPPTDPGMLAPPPTRHRRSASAPRPMNHPANSPDERTAQPSGLSSLLSRPNSMIARRSSTESASLDTQASSSHDFTSSESSPPSGSSSPTTPEASSSHVNEHRDSATNDSADAHRALSPGSIDVLGTLLSVAAAATAASLFSPTFAPTPGVPPANPASSRPLSPTPTAGLGGLGGLDGLAGLNLDPTAERSAQSVATPAQNDRDARDRIRNVWETFRERLGLSSRSNSAGQSIMPGTIEGQGAEGDGAPGSTPRMRPGELMLAEMARALNAGLGLAGRSDRPTSENPTPEAPTTDDENRPPAPEAGFERFLLNLQADLRTVLSEDASASNGDTPAPGPSAAVEPTQPVATAVEDLASPSQSEIPHQSTGLDDEEDVDDIVGFGDDGFGYTGSRTRAQHPRTPTPIPNPTIPHIVEPTDRDNQNSRIAPDRRRPAVNLWRIYRFQPIPAPPSQNQLQTSPSTSTPSPIPSETPLHAASARPSGSNPTTPTVTSASIASTSGPSNSAPILATGDANVVVPVIVVGLQSVDTALGRAQANGEEPALAHDDLQEAAADAGIQEDIFAAQDPSNAAASNARPPTPRGRTWQSRAANALRTLRPGRRTGSRGRNSNEGPGSRTFLIYVIGGYYPPNHHMVTGADSLDTYEALWELAELLGQVKPPVATKEDIDNSGLQIIKASEMKRYEEEGRIASNCTDRCLVCLDDYDGEDDIRVMTCKHAFHKDCVDKWLQVGRNNCPACRTQGVSTASNETSPTTAPS